MRAVIIATGKTFDESPRSGDDVPELRPLLCRPFIEHVIEYLQSVGCDHFDVFLNNKPEHFRTILGNGERWGINLERHLVKDAVTPYHRIKSVVANNGQSEPVLLVHGNRLPQLSEAFINDNQYSTTASVFFENSQTTTSNEIFPPAWAGTALVPIEWFNTIDTDSTEETITQHFNRNQDNSTQANDFIKTLDARTYKSLLEANLRVLNKKFTGLLLKTNEIEEHVWISRNVVLHPTAKILPPVFIAQDCRIEKNTIIGPGAIISENTVVDKYASVKNSVIMPDSYIGEALNIRDSIVNKNRMINTRLDADISLTEDFLLGSLVKKTQRPLRIRIPSFIAGFLLFVPTCPLIMLAAIIKKIHCQGSLFQKTEFLQLPAVSDSSDWQTATLYHLCGETKSRDIQTLTGQKPLYDFFFRFLPGLISVLSGHMHIVGLPPRSPEEVKHLPKDWRDLYLKGKPGLITENFVVHGPAANEDDNYTAEIFYATRASLKHDFSLFVRYLRQVFF